MFFELSNNLFWAIKKSTKIVVLASKIAMTHMEILHIIPTAANCRSIAQIASCSWLSCIKCSSC